MWKLIALIVLVIMLSTGCNGKNKIQPIDPAIYKSVPGGSNGGQMYDSDKVHDPANARGLYIW